MEKVMNKYETVIIVTDKIEEKETKNVIKKIKKFIKDHGEIIEAEDMGMRKLAYEIRNCQYGHFYRIFFKAKPEMIAELERTYRITEEILKFITLRIEKCD